MDAKRAASAAAAQDAAAAAATDDDGDDDYMNMVFTDAPAAPETSLQRRQRERREAELRGRHKSKAELAAEEAAKRESALATSLLRDPAAVKRSKGFAMMAKMGFKPGAALGRPKEPPPPVVAATAKEGSGSGSGSGGGSGSKTVVGGDDDGGVSPPPPAAILEPVRISVKDGRGGIGLASERKRKMDEAVGGTGAADAAASDEAKRARPDEGEFRDRVRREREAARKERQLHAAQKVAERMEEDEEQGREEEEETEEEPRSAARPPARGRPLKSINVLWRGLVRAREEAERDRRMRHDMLQSLSRLPTYEDDDEDEDDKRALGKSSTAYVTADDLDEDDTELQEFNSRDVDDRLQAVVGHLRDAHSYCFWCKYAYLDEQMEGCPGKTEEDHD
ncbi:hypothetical protein RB595_009750 [Gaeumannomyces hyphopodioides]